MLLISDHTLSQLNLLKGTDAYVRVLQELMDNPDYKFKIVTKRLSRNEYGTCKYSYYGEILTAVYVKSPYGYYMLMHCDDKYVVHRDTDENGYDVYTRYEVVD